MPAHFASEELQLSFPRAWQTLPNQQAPQGQPLPSGRVLWPSGQAVLIDKKGKRESRSSQLGASW